MSRVYVVQYDYPGTSGGKPVGTVYAQECGSVSPGSWSYTRDPREATRFNSWEEAESVMRQKSWPNATPVPLSEAKDHRVFGSEDSQSSD